MRSRAAQVGADLGSLQIIESGPINLLAKRDHFLDPLAQVFAGTRDRLFHAVKEAGFLLGAAKKGLNHKMAKQLRGSNIWCEEICCGIERTRQLASTKQELGL